MAVFIIAVIIVFVLAMCLFNAGERRDSSRESSNATPEARTTIRCPNCGSPATVKGKQWECGYCGDCGYFR